eukprot:TRINITY_DN56324_c0_g1_i1.p1 TRINITY_DN56324_c0_g1~~TRINITY_DN56324_c0_g1_i1.p1  ORF type:complete len:643 (+),score=133.29 TRINITY_DN56324_c0_g1_i1:51-1979(+)
MEGDFARSTASGCRESLRSRRELSRSRPMMPQPAKAVGRRETLIQRRRSVLRHLGLAGVVCPFCWFSGAAGQQGFAGAFGSSGLAGGAFPSAGGASVGGASAAGFAGSTGGILGSAGFGAGLSSSLGGAGVAGNLGSGLAGGFGGGLGAAGLGLAAGSAASGGGAGGGGAGDTLHKAFEYADIAAYLLQRPAPFSVAECRELCVNNATCAAWEVCAPLGDGCEGCYLVRRAPRRFTTRQGWNAEVLSGREDLGWGDGAADVGAANMTVEQCHEFLLNANGADQNQAFHEPAVMQKYVDCGFKLRDVEKSRQLFVSGQHWPTFTMTNFWDPPVTLPAEMEREMLAGGGRQPRAPRVPAGAGGAGVTRQLHGAMGTTPMEDHVAEKPRGPHTFVLPFFDTNIGHWMKQHGSMNPLQSYEMQSLLAQGDVVIDVGANLGCYTVPFAERVGMHGKVLAFEPFRWMQQLVSANVAANGLSNVWVLPVGLGTQTSRFEARPPQLRFFSSPGGVKLHGQSEGIKNEEAMQLYDWDLPPELVTVVSLDALLLQRSADTAVLGAPAVAEVRLIKIDVEGMEKDVIAGARQVILRFRPIIWTENVAYFSSQGQDTSFLQLMDELEYTCAQAQNAPNDIVCTDRHGRGQQITN